jgi:diacylglycerol kinase (ATP)
MNSAKPGSEAKRIIAAFGHASEGLKAASAHPAFRIELIAMMVMLPLALVFGQSGLERAVLVGSLFLVLIVELLNTGIEAAIDRISTDWNPISKFAKDVGSAAVLLSLVNAAVMWLLILFS